MIVECSFFWCAVIAGTANLIEMQPHVSENGLLANVFSSFNSISQFMVGQHVVSRIWTSIQKVEICLCVSRDFITGYVADVIENLIDR